MSAITLSGITVVGGGRFCLNLQNSEQRDGAAISLMIYTGQPWQKWIYEDGAIKLTANRQFCLSLETASKSNGAVVSLQTYTGQPWQKWDVCGSAIKLHNDHQWLLTVDNRGDPVCLWQDKAQQSQELHQEWAWSLGVDMPTDLAPASDQDVLVDRVAGAVLGVFIGDALGMGVHWQYDLDKLAADRGYVTDYLTPLPGTYHAGHLTAGQLEVQGACDKLLLQSLAEKHKLEQGDYLSRFEAAILRDPSMDGTRQGGRYGWTDKVILDFWKKRVQAGLPWEQCVPTRNDTPDAAVRGALLAARYHASPYELCVQVNNHAKAQTGDSSIHQHSVAFALLVAGVIQGQPLDGDLGHKLYQQCGTVLPFSNMHSDKDHDDRYGDYSEPDSLDFISSIWKGIGGLDKKFSFQAEPPNRGVQMYGQACAFWECLASAYYCIARFPDDFEKAVLCSVNGGGSNTVRSSLVASLLGAQCGLSKIPPRFLSGLDDSEQLVAWAKQVASDSLHGIAGDKWQWPPEQPLEQCSDGEWTLISGETASG